MQTFRPLVQPFCAGHGLLARELTTKNSACMGAGMGNLIIVLNNPKLVPTTRWPVLHLRYISRRRIRPTPGNTANWGREGGNTHRRAGGCGTSAAQLPHLGPYPIHVSTNVMFTLFSPRVRDLRSAVASFVTTRHCSEAGFLKYM